MGADDSEGRGDEMRSPIILIGGKGHMQAKLLPLIPSHKTYVEPFCGGASLFFAKKPSPIEVLNDIDGTIVSLFRMLRDPDMFVELQRRLSLTPYSRLEYQNCLDTWRYCEDEIEKVRRWLVVNRQSRGGRFGLGWSYTKTLSRRGMAKTASAWKSIIDELYLCSERLKQAQIDCIDFRKCIEVYDSPDTFFYCDPPYLPLVRTSGLYKHEMSLSDHKELIKVLLGIKGKALLSGYNNELYDTLVTKGKWNRIDFDVYCSVVDVSAERKRTESTWLNYDTVLETTRSGGIRLHA